MTIRKLHDAAMAAKRFHDAAMLAVERPANPRLFSNAVKTRYNLKQALAALEQE